MRKVMVLYSAPYDVQQFISEYAKQLVLFYEKMEIQANVNPNTVVKNLPTPKGWPPYYQLSVFPIESPETSQAAMSSPAMQEVGVDANRISTGSASAILICNAG